MKLICGYWFVIVFGKLLLTAPGIINYALLFLIGERVEGTPVHKCSISYCACANHVSISYVMCFVMQNICTQPNVYYY